MLGRAPNPHSLHSTLTDCVGFRYFNLHERDTPNTSPLPCSTLWSTPGKQTCGSKGGNREGFTPDPSTGGDKEADHKEEDKERHEGDGDKKTTPSLGSTKKRRPSAVEGKSALKRRRISSPHRDEAVDRQGECGMCICTLESEWPV